MDKNKTHSYCLQEIHFRSKHNTETESEECKKIFHANGNEKKAGVAISVSDKTSFKTKIR